MTISEKGRNLGITSSLFSKQGQVVVELAQELLTFAPDETIMRVQEYAARLDASSGTIHAALGYLQDVNAIKLEGRGRLGTVAEELNYPLLWTLAHNRPFVGAMPLPYTKRFEGLATGLREQFSPYPLDLDMRFLRGSSKRLQGLASRHFDWVVLSRFAAETAQVHGFVVDIVMLLRPDSYTVNHILLARRNVTELRDGLRIGIDTRSTDHTWVVRNVCRGLRVEYVEIDYSQGMKLLEDGTIDITIWTQEDLPAEFDEFNVIPVEKASNVDLQSLSEAALVVEEGNKAAVHVLQSVLDSSRLRRTQREVVRNTRLPAY